MAATTGDARGGIAPPAAVALIALGHVAGLLALPSTPSLATIAVLEGAVLVAVAALTALTGPVREVGAVAVGYAAAVAGTWSGADGASLWVVAVALVAVLGLIGYALHRYELVTLGLVDPEDVERDGGIGDE